MATQQFKSKERISAHGEVFTAKREVQAMCDLVKQETERIESRFLEPACGNGNFLAEVLERKLTVVKNRYGKDPCDYERYAFLAVSALYGVDLLPDNVAECRARLYDLWHRAYKTAMKKKADQNCQEALRYILQKNILCGDALTMNQSDGEPIVFAEWSLVTGDQFKRRDFVLSELLLGEQKQISMWTLGWEYDQEIEAYIPKPIIEYPLTAYRKVQTHG